MSASLHLRLWQGLGHNDVDNAARFTLLHGDRIRFVHAWGKWLIWDETRWRIDHRGVLALELAKDVPRDLYRLAATQPPSEAKETARWAGHTSSRARLAAMVDLARGMEGVLIDHNQLDADPWAFCVANGWLDLRSGAFHEPDPSQLMIMQAGTAWDLAATAPLWDKCLAEWMPDQEVRSYFQRLCGASLVGQIRDHMLVMVWGSGGNGKGTALGAIAHVLGDYFTVPHKSLLVAQRHESHDTVKASLFRTRMAVAAESDKRVRLNEASVKELTGGDLLRARRLYEDEWSFTPSHTLWLQTNYLPEVSGSDRGIWRRIRVLPWHSTFTGAQEDRELRQKLEAESSGILRWLLDGVAQWLEVGLGDDTVPTTVSTATEEYRRSEDLVARWAAETGLTIGNHLTADSRALIDSWQQWTLTELGRRRAFREVKAWLEDQNCRADTYRLGVGDQRRQVTRWVGVGWPTLPLSDPTDTPEELIF